MGDHFERAGGPCNGASFAGKKLFREVYRAVVRITKRTTDLVFEKHLEKIRNDVDSRPGAEELRLHAEVHLAVKPELAAGIGCECAGGDFHVVGVNRLIGNGKGALAASRLRIPQSS